jgi:hypothetical protein
MRFPIQMEILMYNEMKIFIVKKRVERR